MLGNAPTEGISAEPRETIDDVWHWQLLLCKVLVPLCAGHPRAIVYAMAYLQNDFLYRQQSGTWALICAAASTVATLSCIRRYTTEIPFPLAFNGQFVTLETIFGGTTVENYMTCFFVAKTWSNGSGIFTMSPIGLIHWACQWSKHPLARLIQTCIFPNAVDWSTNFETRWMALTGILRYAFAEPDGTTSTLEQRLTVLEYFSRPPGHELPALQPLHSPKYNMAKRNMGCRKIKLVSDRFYEVQPVMGLEFKDLSADHRADFLQEGGVSQVRFGSQPGFEGVEIDITDPTKPVLICYSMKGIDAGTKPTRNTVRKLVQQYTHFLKQIEPHLGLSLSF